MNIQRILTMLFTAFTFLVVPTLSSLNAAEPLIGKSALGDKFPKAVFFRIAQNQYENYEQWAQRFGQLDGMVTKAGYEEVPHLDWELLLHQMNRFALENPDQLVIIHYNGRERLLLDDGNRRPLKFPGHYAYRESFNLPEGPAIGSKSLKLSREDADQLRQILRTERRSHTPNFPMPGILVALDQDGNRDWQRTEFVGIPEVDANGYAQIQRGFIGSTPRDFEGETVQLALMASRFGRDYGVYNFATTCPLDEQGRSAIDVFLEDFKMIFGPGGPGEALDGINMDVLYFEPFDFLDVNNDGVADGGIIDGENLYAKGVIELMARLQAILGPERLFHADGHLDSNQRGVPWMNGMESEGIVSHRDSYRGISKTINYFSYYRRHASAPQINFTFPKDNTVNNVKMEDRIARYGLAVTTALGELTSHNILRVTRTEHGQLHDAPRPARIADELVAGRLNRRHWLGRPLAPFQLIGLKEPVFWQMTGNIEIPVANEKSTTIRPIGENTLRMDSRGIPSITIPNLNFSGGDLIVTFDARASGSEDLGAQIPTRIYISTPDAHPPHNDEPIRALAGPTHWQPVIAYFRDIAPGKTSLNIQGDGPGWIEIRNLEMRNSPLALLREFENGTVMANLAANPIEINLQGSTHGGNLYHLEGSPNQNRTVNNGQKAEDIIRLEPVSGLFLKTAE